MKTYRRAVIGVVAAVVLVAIAGVIAINTLASPERLKAMARDKARAALNRDLEIGDMSLALFPWPTLHASNVTLIDAPGDKDPWKLHVDRADIGLDLWSLLMREPWPSDAHIEVGFVRNGQPVKVVADLADISRKGNPDASAQGKVDLDFGKTRATLNGRIPLQAKMRGSDFKAQVDSPSLSDVLAFFAYERPRPTASAHATFTVRDASEQLEVLDGDLTLGKHRFTGDARVSNSKAGPVTAVRIKGDRLDWAQVQLEAGGPVREPLPPGEMFYDYPWAWPLLVGLQGKVGTIDAHFGSLRMRNGVELQDVKADMAFDGDKLDVKRVTMNTLGGSGVASMHFEGRKKEVRVKFEGKNLLLERWFKERKRDIPFTGGPMLVTADIAGAGNSMREVAASINGPITIRMGPGVWAKEKAGDMEAYMVAFSKKNSSGAIEFECVAARLPFVQGIATGEGIVGAKSDVSRILGSGDVSFREQTLDLRGRVQPKPGMGVGFAAIDGDIRLSGKIRQIKVSLDPAGTPKAVAKAGVAILTLGMSLAATKAANDAKGDPDPCADVFRTAKTP